ncbi:hypothetical protein N658DRAFT_19170 [Parathielavia hyrcaniae]|uniref:Uncharacterized protein n=1 Tax=Parathielavia hyrcaniae TaxID=113614 RepID=A0AAN6QDW5_9PEZI|nr:hypothetical protein N658DRAFT_19170 [Parathielavia hyrcaniae]
MAPLHQRCLQSAIHRTRPPVLSVLLWRGRVWAINLVTPIPDPPSQLCLSSTNAGLPFLSGLLVASPSFFCLSTLPFKFQQRPSLLSASCSFSLHSTWSVFAPST